MSNSTTTVIASDPYAVALSIYRNREWIQYFKVSQGGIPLDLSRDALALVVLDAKEEMVLSNMTPTVGSGDGSVSFVYADGDTSMLTANARYNWQFLRRPYGSHNSDLLTAGPLTVSESPPFP